MGYDNGDKNLMVLPMWDKDYYIHLCFKDVYT